MPIASSITAAAANPLPLSAGAAARRLMIGTNCGVVGIRFLLSKT